MLSRRTFIAAGAAASAALAAAYWWQSSPMRSSASARTERDGETTAIVAAIVPAMVADMLPSEPAARAGAIDATVAGVAPAIAGLPPAAQHEIAQLFALLAFAPARIAVAGVSAPWREASGDDVSAFLERWRASRLQMLRSAYDALHQLVFAAWYADPRAWAAIGYPGPPELGS